MADGTAGEKFNVWLEHGGRADSWYEQARMRLARLALTEQGWDKIRWTDASYSVEVYPFSRNEFGRVFSHHESVEVYPLHGRYAIKQSPLISPMDLWTCATEAQLLHHIELIRRYRRDFYALPFTPPA